MSTIADPLIDYLHQLQAQGKTHVHVDDDARILLREFYRRAQGGAVPKPVSQPRQEPSRVEGTEPESQVQATAVEVSEPEGLSVQGANAEEKLECLRGQARNWQPARAMGGFRETMVFSTGNPQADIMLIGEAPGYDEERVGEPFAGRAGRKLDAILKAMGTERKQTYITNIVKFRPKMPNQTTNNRKPTAQELEAWLPFVQEEVKIVSPKVLIALGGAAAQALLGCEKSVGQLRGEFHRFEGLPLCVTYHPSYILHEGATPEKRMLWEDMLSVMDSLGMPISEKQRGFFK